MKTHIIRFCTQSRCKATPNKFPVSHPLPASPSWSQCGPIIRLLMTSQTCKCQFTFAMRPANGGHVVERDDTTSAAPKHSCSGPSLSQAMIGCLSVNSIFTEVPVKVQISCNLEPCRLNKLIIITARPPV